MNADDHPERKAILDVIAAEADAYQRRDFEELARHWIKTSDAHRMLAFAASGVVILKSWDEISDNYRRNLTELADSRATIHPVRRDNVKVVIGTDMAWVTYEQHGEDLGDRMDMPGVHHELKILHKIDGTWHLACLAMMQSRIDWMTYPVVEVDSSLRIIWMNTATADLIKTHPGLIATGGHLRARRRAFGTGLETAVAEATGFKTYDVMARHYAVAPRAVMLGEDDEGRMTLCWVMPIENRVLVSFDNDQMVERRLSASSAIFNLSPTQVQLAVLLARGDPLGDAADKLGISVNTARTHVARMFDKTGAHSQSALLALLLSVLPPET